MRWLEVIAKFVEKCAVGLTYVASDHMQVDNGYLEMLLLYFTKIIRTVPELTELRADAR